MSTYKLSPLEELRLEKKRYNEQRTIVSQRLSYQLQYLNDNWGTMLTKGVTSSIRTKLSETVDSLSDMLQNGRFACTKIYECFQNAGVSKRIADSAKKKLEVKSVKLTDGWYWSL